MSELVRLKTRIEELEALCGLPGEAAPNPFVGIHRRRLLTIASLLARRDRVSNEAISLAIGSIREALTDKCVAAYVTHLRKQLPGDVVILREFRVGYYVNDKAKLAAVLRGESAQ